MSEWKEVKLGDLITIKYGKDHKKLKDGNIPVYGSGGIMRYVDSQLYDKPSLLLPRKGSLNNIFYTDSAFWTVDTMFWSTIDEDKVNPKFLYYSMFKKNLSLLNIGTSIPSLSVQILNDIDLTIPDLPTQQRIASILSSLDAKIENNNKTNAKLEEIAQNLFKEWFVDFGPFKNGKFVESELGLIPEGWRVGTLGEIAQANRRTVPKGWSFYNYLDTGNITSNKIDSYQFFDNSENLPSRAKRGVADCDILYSTVRPEQRHYGLILNPVENMVASTGFAVITPNDSGFAYYIYSILTQDDSIKILQSIAEQSTSTYPSIKAEDILNQQIIIPSDETIRKFAEISSSFYCKIDANNTENKQLATLRDTLLPKLMSGEIEV